MRKISLFLFLSCMVFLSSAFADESVIEKELENFIKEAVAQTDDLTETKRLQQSSLAIQSSIASEQYSQALNLIQSHIQLNPKSIKSASALSKSILAELTKEAEKEVERKKKFFTDLAKSLINAKEIEEIDPWLIKLNEEIQRDGKHSIYTQPVWNPSVNYIPNSRGYRDFWTTNARYQSFCGMPTQLRQETQTALRITTAWQDYIHALALEDKRTARNYMSNIASYSASFIYIPRSKILKLSGDLIPKSEAKQNSVEIVEMEDVQHRLKTAKDAVLLFHELYRLSSSKMSPQVIMLKDELREFKEAFNYINGENVNYGVGKLHALKSSPYVGDLAFKCLVDFVKNSLDVPDEVVIKKEDNAQVWVDQYLQKLATEKKWSELRQAIVITSSLITRDIGSDKNPRAQDIEALKLLIAAENYQKSELYHRAAVAYRAVLGKAVFTPEINDEASSQLKKIRKEHPKSYLLAEDMYGHDTNNTSKGRDNYLQKLIEIEIRKVAKEMQDGAKGDQEDKE